MKCLRFVLNNIIMEEIVCQLKVCTYNAQLHKIGWTLTAPSETAMFLGAIDISLIQQYPWTAAK